MNRYHCLYPEDQWVSEDEIRSWASDAWANGELEDDPTGEPISEVIRMLNDEGDSTIVDIPLDNEAASLFEDIDHTLGFLKARDLSPGQLGHPAECSCYICMFGYDAYVWNFHPAEY